MSAMSFYRMVMRHRVVFFLFAGLTLAAMVGVVVLKPAVYRSSGSLVLLNPPSPPDVVVDENGQTTPTSTVNYENPYARFGDLTTVVDIVARIMLSSEVKNELAAQGVTMYEVAANRDFQRGPIIEVAAEADSPQAAQDHAAAVLTTLQDVLVDRQTSFGTDPTYFIQTQLVEEPGVGTRVVSSTLRTLIGVTALGGLMTLGAVLLAEYWSVHRARRRDGDRHDDGDGDGDGDAARQLPPPSHTSSVPAAETADAP